MGSLAVPEKMADAVTRPPELSDAEYVRAVLRQPTSKTEDELDQELLAAAQKLGIDLSTPPIAATRPSTPSSDKRISSGTEPGAVAVTPARSHARTASATSNASGTTAAYRTTSNRSASTLPQPERTLARKRSKSLSFSQYDRYLSQVDPNLHQPKFLSHTSSRSASDPASDTTFRSVWLLKRGLTQRLKWRRGGRRKTAATTGPSPPEMSCICCREDFAASPDHSSSSSSSAALLHTLPCGHTYCRSCLSVMIAQSTTDESKMPPRCCTQPIPGATIKSVLSRDEQQAFLKAVVQFSTPWESRVFCPNPLCGEFIPPKTARQSDPRHHSHSHHHHRHPFEVATCRACRTSVCVMCGRAGGHPPGQDCPEDWELDAVLRMGERSGWRRCYKCRTLVELAQGCTHMTCRCRAQFCYICGAAWDSLVGCPNYCNGEEELERRRAEEEAREAEVEAEKAAREEARRVEEAERREAEGRTRESGECEAVRERWRTQMEEFRRFEGKMRWVMWTRHSQKRLAVMERHRDVMEKTSERHAKTEQHLEDRQVEAEIELRSALEQSEKSIRIQLKYMEAYCNGPSRLLPEREVTRKHREQLARQYHLRDGMERRHQSQINVLREKQAKRMEELMERHAKEMAALVEKRAEEVEDLGLQFTNEEEALVRVFRERRERMVRRWVLEGEILRRQLEEKHGVRYGSLALPEWPGDGDPDEGLPSVREEDALGDE